MAASDETTVSGSIKGLHGDNRYSDLDIICGDRKWQVHKAVVCTRCKFFEKAVNGRFKESASNTIDLADDPPNAVGALICWLYTDEYNENAHSDELGESDRDFPWSALPFNMHVHAIADKYGLAKFAEVALGRFKWRLQAMPNTGEAGFYESIRLAFGVDGEWRNARFRELLLRCVMSRGKPLVCHAGFQETAAQVPAFAAALVVETFRLDKREEFTEDGTQKNREYECSSCGTKFTVDSTLTELYCPSCTQYQW